MTKKHSSKNSNKQVTTARANIYRPNPNSRLHHQSRHTQTYFGRSGNRKQKARLQRYPLKLQSHITEGLNNIEKFSQKVTNFKNAALPALIPLNKLPGPASMYLLQACQLLVQLDATCSYLRERASNIFGRSSIIKQLLPPGTIACDRLAFWILTGGIFPKILDVVSNSHFRAPAFGRRFRVHNRSLPEAQLLDLSEVQTTTPLRTACDIACGGAFSGNRQDSVEDVQTLMNQYEVNSDDCIDLLNNNPNWPGHPTGMEIFTDLKTGKQWN